MIDYREILRLDSFGYSRRRISSMVNSSHHTVEDTLKAAHDTGITWPQGDDVTNAELQGILFPWKYVSDSAYAMPDFAYIHRELAKNGVTLTLLWEEYCTKVRGNGSVPYSYTQFGEKYRRWARVTKATMRITHKPGDAVQVDWAGDPLYITDSVTGEQLPAYIFIAVGDIVHRAISSPNKDVIQFISENGSDHLEQAIFTIINGLPDALDVCPVDQHPIEIIELFNKKERHFVQYFQCHFNLTLPGRHSTIYGPKSPYMVGLLSRILLRCCHADRGRAHHDNKGVCGESHHRTVPGAKYDDQRTGPLISAAAVDIEKHRERSQSEPGHRHDQKALRRTGDHAG